MLSFLGITLAAAKNDQNQPGIMATKIQFAKIKHAGLLDPDTADLTPALRIDYNFYSISWLNVINSVSDGISISYRLDGIDGIRTIVFQALFFVFICF